MRALHGPELEWLLARAVMLPKCSQHVMIDSSLYWEPPVARKMAHKAVIIFNDGKIYSRSGFGKGCTLGIDHHGYMDYA